ncbi:MAG: MerR family transcriptional regulator [bacterium]
MTKVKSAERLYYSISEASRITGLEAYVLRYWEKEFPALKPRKNSGGSRMYTAKDIELVNRIKHLRTKEKLTIAGARAKLTMKRPSEDGQTMKSAAHIKTVIGQIRNDISDLLELFA